MRKRGSSSSSSGKSWLVVGGVLVGLVVVGQVTDHSTTTDHSTVTADELNAHSPGDTYVHYRGERDNEPTPVLVKVTRKHTEKQGKGGVTVTDSTTSVQDGVSTTTTVTSGPKGTSSSTSSTVKGSVAVVGN